MVVVATDAPSNTINPISMDSSMIRCCANGRWGTFQMKFSERRMAENAMDALSANVTRPNTPSGTAARAAPSTVSPMKLSERTSKSLGSS